MHFSCKVRLKYNACLCLEIKQDKISIPARQSTKINWMQKSRTILIISPLLIVYRLIAHRHESVQAYEGISPNLSHNFNMNSSHHTQKSKIQVRRSAGWVEFLKIAEYIDNLIILVILIEFQESKARYLKNWQWKKKLYCTKGWGKKRICSKLLHPRSSNSSIYCLLLLLLFLLKSQITGKFPSTRRDLALSEDSMSSLGREIIVKPTFNWAMPMPLYFAVNLKE